MATAAFVFVAVAWTAIYIEFFIPDKISSVNASLFTVSYKKVPDWENAYKIIELALGGQDEEYPELKKYLDGERLSAAEINLLQVKYKARLDLLRYATTLPHSQAPWRKTIFDSTPNFIGLLRLSQIMALTARQYGEEERYGEAMGQLKTLFELSKIIEAKDGGSDLLGLMIGLKMKEIGLQELNKLLTMGYRLDDEMEPQRYFERFKLNPLALETAIKIDYNLLSDAMSKYRRGDPEILAAFSSSRVLKIKSIRRLILKPGREVAERRRYYYSNFIDASRQYYSQMSLETPPKAEGDLPSVFKLIFSGNYHRTIHQRMLLDYSAAFERKCRNDFFIDAARLRIAALRYFSAEGKLPVRLETLVPVYIEKYPVDPFDGAPMRYDMKNLLIYSVGRNLKDDHAVRLNNLEDPPKDKNKLWAEDFDPALKIM